MMERILLSDYLKSPRNLAIKIVLPIIVVLISAQYSVATFALVMIIIFTVCTGSGLKIVSLKSSKVFERLLILPVSKKRLFLEHASIYTVLYSLQLAPAIVVGMMYSSMTILLYVLPSILLVTIIGTLVGLHAKGFGEIHLFSLFTMIPLVGLAMVKLPISYCFPFIFVTYPAFDLLGFFFSLVAILALVLILLVDVSRL